MTPDEIKTLFALMRTYRVSHFKRGDVDVVMDLEGTIPEINLAMPIDPKEAKYWSAPEPKIDDSPEPTA